MKKPSKKEMREYYQVLGVSLESMLQTAIGDAEGKFTTTVSYAHMPFEITLKRKDMKTSDSEWHSDDELLKASKS